MDMAIKIVTLIGGLMSISGLFWMLFGVYEVFAGRKNKRPEQRDEGQEGIINGFALAAFSATITAAIVAAIRAIKF
ncbi:hypothetical protein E4T82_11650 [Streptococcus cuniculi]|uniref:Uncharacterized protein n=2 Tax=Streptococcus TaxID=1301 RepID=A0A4Y9J976_9STRE|nr:hypothetical protein [Streptococcus cuniculi]TFU96646.1 hypothetical protein E4T82_11650 [Streptococcus cuniculi]